MPQMSPPVYLKQELGFKFDEWSGLSKEDQATLRKWAEEEMVARGQTA